MTTMMISGSLATTTTTLEKMSLKNIFAFINYFCCLFVFFSHSNKNKTLQKVLIKIEVGMTRKPKEAGSLY